jgi:hypothetical protein
MGKKKFRFSKKLFMALVTAGVVVANEGLGLGLPEEAIYTLAGVAASYIFGQAAVDRKLIDNGLKTK